MVNGDLKHTKQDDKGSVKKPFFHRFGFHFSDTSYGDCGPLGSYITSIGLVNQLQIAEKFVSKINSAKNKIKLNLEDNFAMLKFYLISKKFQLTNLGIFKRR